MHDVASQVYRHTLLLKEMLCHTTLPWQQQFKTFNLHNARCFQTRCFQQAPALLQWPCHALLWRTRHTWTSIGGSKKSNGKSVPLTLNSNYQFCRVIKNQLLEFVPLSQNQLLDFCHLIRENQFLEFHHLACVLYLLATKPPCCSSVAWDFNKIFNEVRDIEPKDAADRQLSHGVADRYLKGRGHCPA